MRRDCCLRDVMTLPFMNNKGYIFIVRRLGKQSKLILSRSDSISNLKLNLRYMAHVAQMLTQEPIHKSFSISCFKLILLSAHKLILLIYGDNTCPLVLAMIVPKPIRRFIFPLMLINTLQPPRKMQRLCNRLLVERETADPTPIFSLFNLTRIGSFPQQTPSSS